MTISRSEFSFWRDFALINCRNSLKLIFRAFEILENVKIVDFENINQPKSISHKNVETKIFHSLIIEFFNS